MNILAKIRSLFRRKSVVPVVQNDASMPPNLMFPEVSERMASVVFSASKARPGSTTRVKGTRERPVTTK